MRTSGRSAALLHISRVKKQAGGEVSCFWSLEGTQRSSSARTRRSNTLRAEASDRGETREGQQGEEGAAQPPH